MSHYVYQVDMRNKRIQYYCPVDEAPAGAAIEDRWSGYGKTFVSYWVPATQDRLEQVMGDSAQFYFSGGDLGVYSYQWSRQYEASMLAHERLQHAKWLLAEGRIEEARAHLMIVQIERGMK